MSLIHIICKNTSKSSDSPDKSEGAVTHELYTNTMIKTLFATLPVNKRKRREKGRGENKKR